MRSDIYSLGCTLYYVLTGVPPFAGNSLAEVLLKHQTQDPKPVAAHRHDSPCPRVLEAIYRKMMAKD
ncbi:MAG: serine/threonine protein kinase, partial [Betaproteobacteria bacterium]